MKVSFREHLNILYAIFCEFCYSIYDNDIVRSRISESLKHSYMLYSEFCYSMIIILWEVV